MNTIYKSFDWSMFTIYTGWCRTDVCQIVLDGMRDQRAVREQIGAIVRELRSQRGLTQFQLAGLAGNSERNIGEIEAGKSNTTIDSLVAIATALGVDVIDLLTLNAADVLERSKLPLTADEIDCCIKVGAIGLRFKRPQE